MRIKSNNIFTSRIFPFVLAIFFVVPLIILFSQPKPVEQQHTDAAVLAAVDTASGNPAPNGPKGDYHLIFSDEFNGNSLDLTKWITCNPSFDYSCHPKNGEQEYNAALTNNKNIVVSGGQLHLVATNANGKMQAGMVSTGPNTKFKANQPGYKGFSYTYGYYEGRVKVPKGKGFWPSMWELPWDQDGKGGWPKSGEYDVWEIPGNDPTNYNFTIHWLGNGSCGLSQCEGGVKKVADTSAGFHTFGLLWEEKKMTWYMDGVAQGTLDKPAAIKNYPFYIIANFAVGGKWGPLHCQPGGAFPCGGGYPPFPTSMDIDYLRVWQKGKPATSVPASPSKVVPTYVCAGSTTNICPSSTPTKATTPTKTVTNPTVVIPSGAGSEISPQPTVSDTPCQESITSITSTGESSRHMHARGLLSAFLEFLIELFKMLISLIGGGNVPQPIPSTENGSPTIPCPSPSSSFTAASSVARTILATIVPSATPKPATQATSKFTPPDGKTYLGVAGNVTAFTKAAGITTHPALYNGFTANNGSFKEQLAEIEKLPYPQMTPIVSWNVDFRQNRVTNGSLDGYLKTSALAAKAWKRPIFVRMNWEMNSNWTNYYDPSVGVDPQKYIASWKHVYNIFKTEGVTNVTWVWCPNIGRPVYKDKSPFDWYPGNEYVDWICVDVYPDGNTNPYNPGIEVTRQDGLNVFGDKARSLKKPLMVGEWARGWKNNHEDKTGAFDTIFGWANKYPDVVKALVYFDVANDNDHVLETHPVGAAAFRKYTVGNARYSVDTAK